MTESCHTLLGLVEIVPNPSCPPCITSDEATLQGWFERAAAGDEAHAHSAASQPVLCKSDRWSRDAQSASSSVVRADLTQLLADLDREYQQALRRREK